jgi:hypothetical protein
LAGHGLLSAKFIREHKTDLHLQRGANSRSLVNPSLTPQPEPIVHESTGDQNAKVATTLADNKDEEENDAGSEKTQYQDDFSYPAIMTTLSLMKVISKSKVKKLARMQKTLTTTESALTQQESQLGDLERYFASMRGQHRKLASSKDRLEEKLQEMSKKLALTQERLQEQDARHVEEVAALQKLIDLQMVSYAAETMKLRRQDSYSETASTTVGDEMVREQKVTDHGQFSQSLKLNNLHRLFDDQRSQYSISTACLEKKLSNALQEVSAAREEGKRAGWAEGIQALNKSIHAETVSHFAKLAESQEQYVEDRNKTPSQEIEAEPVITENLIRAGGLGEMARDTSQTNEATDTSNYTHGDNQSSRVRIQGSQNGISEAESLSNGNGASNLVNPCADMDINARQHIGHNLPDSSSASSIVRPSSNPIKSFASLHAITGEDDPVVPRDSLESMLPVSPNHSKVGLSSPMSRKRLQEDLYDASPPPPQRRQRLN